MDLSIVILAAGKGSRMHSAKPKVLHTLAGEPLLCAVLKTALSLSPTAIYCVVGHEQDQIKAEMAHSPCIWVEQQEQLGTAHALHQAIPHIKSQRVLVLLGDVPLISPQTLKAFIDQTPPEALGIISYITNNPKGFGRIIRDTSGAIVGVVEEKDATEAQRLINEVASGIYLADSQAFERWLPLINNQNAGNEYYLPDVIPLALKESRVLGYVLTDPEEALGVNDKEQLAQAERVLQQRRAQALMQAGVTVMDPARLDVRGTIKAGKDVSIDINCIFEGTVVLGEGCRIGAHCILRDAIVGPGCEILPNTIIDGAQLGAKVTIGPFARIRPGTVLEAGVKIGNFVEVKQTTMGEGSKANHLSYLGDAVIGAQVNIGAGTITCNYDGVNKSTTTIADGAFIGSNASLVAPVDIGMNAVIGAGSVITKDAPSEQLTVARAKQTTLPSWHRPQRADNQEE